jgi:predicted 3-demethylubiquinone-9 3-methyltransferase (glyoxalase superfamily)
MARVLERETFFLGVSILMPFLRRLHGGRRLAAPFGQHHGRFAMTIQKKITPFLWYSKEAEEAAAFYAAIFPDSRVIRVTAMPSESPSGPPGSVKIVEFVLFGQPFLAMSAGPLDPFNHSVSFVVNCDDQAELDRYWNALLEGGSPEQCGWLKDRFGLSWQIVPTVLGEMVADPDQAKAKRAADAMLKMVKLDIAALKAAHSGTMD